MNKLLICLALTFLQASCLTSNETDPDLTNWDQVEIRWGPDEGLNKLFREKIFNNSEVTTRVHKRGLQVQLLPNIYWAIASHKLLGVYVNNGMVSHFSTQIVDLYSGKVFEQRNLYHWGIWSYSDDNMDLWDKTIQGPPTKPRILVPEFRWRNKTAVKLRHTFYLGEQHPY